jgi:hypothetical protein
MVTSGQSRARAHRRIRSSVRHRSSVAKFSGSMIGTAISITASGIISGPREKR